MKISRAPCVEGDAVTTPKPTPLQEPECDDAERLRAMMLEFRRGLKIAVKAIDDMYGESRSDRDRRAFEERTGKAA